MKDGVTVLNHDTGFRNMKKELFRRYGKETTDRIWKKAGENLESLCSRYDHLSKVVKIHTHGNMFRNAALYLAIKEEYPNDAMAVLEQGAKAEGLRVARMITALCRIPGTKALVLPVFSKMQERMFGEAAGFQCIRYNTPKNEVRFDITQCPYCKYLTEIGCPELVHISCDIDEHIYGNLPEFAFSRISTIGTGASCCDFCLKRRTE